MKLSRVSEAVAAVKLQVKITKCRIVDFLGKLRYIVLGVILGGSWMFVYIQAAPDVKDIFSEKRIVIENVVVHPAKAKEIEKPSRSEEIADIIHNLESSRGRKNYSKCEEQGKYNEYGYGIPGDGRYRCFDKGKDRVAVIGWIEDKLAQGFTEKELACFYNTGKRTETCPPYGEHFGQ